MIEVLPVGELPFTVASSTLGVWRVDEHTGAVVADAPAHTDLYINPGGAESGDAASMLNAATLLGAPPTGDFQLSARVTVEFVAQYDAGVLMLWIDERHWAKFCFELSPAAEPMVVSVVTRDVSDDAKPRRRRPVRVAPRIPRRPRLRVPCLDRRTDVAPDPGLHARRRAGRAQDRVRGAIS